MREGWLLLADNTLPDAMVTEMENGTKHYNAAAAQRKELTTIVVPIPQQKRLEGLTVSVKRTNSTASFARPPSA